jgi:uncharacterized protein
MFSLNALRQADERLTDVYRKRGWEIVFETIDTLDGKSIDRVTEDKARALQVRGVYFLIAKREHKIHYWIERPALNTFDKATVESANQKIIGGFKQGQFNDGLLNATEFLADAAARGPSATEQKGFARSAPAASRPEFAPRSVGADGTGSFLARALVIGAVIVVVLLVIRVIGAMARGGSAASPGVGYGAGGPGYGYGSGGGFFGNLMGGIGGALLGNYLYNSFFGGGQVRAAEQFGEPTSSSTNPAAFDDQGVSGGGEWDDSTSAEEAGGDGDPGADDFGGGDMGGSDFGGDSGGDSGGGDW